MEERFRKYIIKGASSFAGLGRKLVGTSASLLVTSALLVVTRSY